MSLLGSTPFVPVQLSVCHMEYVVVSNSLISCGPRKICQINLSG